MRGAIGRRGDADGGKIMVKEVERKTEQDCYESLVVWSWVSRLKKK